MQDIREHHRLLGIATIVYHSFNLLVLFVIIPIFAGVSVFSLSDAPEVSGVLLVVLSIIIFIILALALPGIIGGVGLIKGKSWGRAVTIIANVIALLSFPIGTALAVYTYWVLFMKQDESDQTMATI